MSCQASFDVTSFWRQGSWWLEKDDKQEPTQYISSIPCSKETQEDINVKAQARCKNFSGVLDLLLILSIILHFPMVVIIFKFLSNQCGDEFEAESQFAIIFSSDEEDEWLPDMADKNL